MKTTSPNFLQLFQVLVRSKVDFILVGGMGAVIQGAPITTFDLDLVHSRKPENIQRLLKALSELNALFRAQAGRKIQPDESHLSTDAHTLLITSEGPLDLLGTIGRNLDYEKLLPHSRSMKIGSGLTIQVLGLAKLIEIKEETGRDKDKAMLPILKKTLEEQSKK